MATPPLKYFKELALNGNSYPIASKYIADGAGFKDWSDIVALANAGFSAIVSTDAASTPKGITWGSVTGTLEAAVANKNAIYFVPETDKLSGEYVEYIVVGETPVWERIGTTTVDVSGKADKGTYTSSSNGAHTHTVTGTIAVPTVSQTQKHLTISRSTDAALSTTKGDVLGTATTFSTTVTPSITTLGATATSGGYANPSTGTFLKGVKVNGTDDVLGANATFTTTVDPAITNVKATAAGAAIATSNASFVQSYPGATSNMAVTSLKGVSGTTTASKQTTAGSVDPGNAAKWSATVNEAGVLSFSFTANKVTGVTMPTYADVTVATANATATTVATGSLDASGTGATVMTGLGTPTTAKALTAASVSTQPTITLANNAAAGTGVVSVATGISSVSTVINSADTVTAALDVAENGNGSAITGLGAFTNPTVTLSTGATSGPSVATGITSASTTAGANAVINAIKTASVGTQPAFALADTATTGGVTFVSEVAVGSTTASLTDGAAASNGAHTHTTTI